MNYNYVPSTTYDSGRTKVSDGKSVEVIVPESTTIEAGKFYELDGFFGVAMTSVATAAGETSKIVLNIEQAEYETNQITAADAFDKGDLVYFDKATKLLTTDDAPDVGDPHRKVGRVSNEKDANNVIWFILGSQA